jgi:hypothetical protein
LQFWSGSTSTLTEHGTPKWGIFNRWKWIAFQASTSCSETEHDTLSKTPLPFFLLGLFWGLPRSHRLSSHSRLKAFVIQTKQKPLFIIPTLVVHQGAIFWFGAWHMAHGTPPASHPHRKKTLTNEGDESLTCDGSLGWWLITWWMVNGDASLGNESIGRWWITWMVMNHLVNGEWWWITW